MNHFLLLLSSYVLFTVPSGLTYKERTNPETQSEELGAVSWYRNYKTATQASAEKGKPILILFQEVPGCATCRNYGNNVLRNPLMVEAIEDLFIPLVIFNNKGGEDRITLNQFNEPSWNNPVVRIVDEEGGNLVKRVAGNYSAKGLYKAMQTALINQNQLIPEYFNLLGKELSASNNLKEDYYKMYCFWSGEKHLGAKDGVIKTESGFMNGYEVVKVTYDENEIDKGALTSYAKKGNILPISEDGYRFSGKDHLFYLKRTNYQYLPLSDLQKTKINSALGSGFRAEKYLSPKQLEWLKELNNPSTERKTLWDQDIASAWKEKNQG
ncbi:MAG: VPGUxxT family thioredoxin-like (seleno)protein, type 2 [Bacteroidota bacterium]